MNKKNKQHDEHIKYYYYLIEQNYKNWDKIPPELEKNNTFKLIVLE